MAKIKLDPLFAGISGRMGDLVFRKSRNGEVIVSRRPRKSNTPPSAAQMAQRERFKLASQYARAAISDPTMRVLYEEIGMKEGKSAFAAARADYFIRKDLLSEK
jgi:hypothetical protein